MRINAAVILFPLLLLLPGCIARFQQAPAPETTHKAAAAEKEGQKVRVLEKRIEVLSRQNNRLERQNRGQAEEIKRLKKSLGEKTRINSRLAADNKALRDEVSRLELTLQRLERLDQEMEKKRRDLK